MKKYIISCGTHDTAGLVFKFYKNFGINDCGDSYKVGPLNSDNYDYVFFMDFENKCIKNQYGFKLSMYRCVDIINSKVITELCRDFAEREKEYRFNQSILNEVKSYSK